MDIPGSIWQVLLERAASGLLPMRVQADGLGVERWWEAESHALGGDPTYLYLIGATLILVAAAVCLGARLLLTKRDHTRKLRKQFAEIRGVIQENQERVDLIETHALDYLNSMSSRATRAFGIAKQILLAIDQVATEGEELLKRGDYASLIEAEELLESRLVLKQAHLNAVQDGFQIPDLYRDQWSPTLDKLFQEVGNEISRASKMAREFNLGKRQSKRTYEDLKRAGIRFMKEQGRRLTASFRSPFNKEEKPGQQEPPQP